MGRRLLLVVLMVAAAALSGCGGGEGGKYTDTAPSAKPVDLGDPAQIAMGATSYGSTAFIVKAQVGGETRLYVLSNRVPGPEPNLIQYSPTEKLFFDQRRKHKYDISGEALHTIPKGPNAGQPGLPMDRFKVELDPNNGHVLLAASSKIGKDNRASLEKKAYVVVP